MYDYLRLTNIFITTTFIMFLIWRIRESILKNRIKKLEEIIDVLD